MIDKKLEKKALKIFTTSSCNAIDEELRDVNVDDLISSIFLKYTDDNDINYMLKEYEKMLILSKINNEKFRETLHDFYVKMNEYMKINKLYKKFFKLCHIIYVELNKKNIRYRIACSYFNLLVQQYSYLGGGTKTVPYGVDSKGKLITISEVGRNLTEINYELQRIHKTPFQKFLKDNSIETEIINTFKKYGYKPKNMLDVNRIITYDQTTTNMLFSLAYFIYEDNKSLLPLPFVDCNYLLEFNPLYRISQHKMDIITEKLTHRQILLPNEGVNAKFMNCGDVKEIFFTEVFTEDETVVLLFKVKFQDNTYTLGYYDSQNEVIYDLWKDSSSNDKIHIPLKEMVLQNYMYLTCTLTDEEKEMLFHFGEVEGLGENPNNIQPFVYYEINDKHIVNNKEVPRTRHFDRNQYRLDLKNIAPFLRNLPYGAKASDEAIEMAKRLGIELPAGKTFVRGFKKTVYRKGD